MKNDSKKGDKVSETVNQVKNEVTTAMNPAEVEILKNQIAELKKAIENRPQSISEIIKFVEIKDQKIRNLKVLQETQENLNKVLFQSHGENNDFEEAKNLRLILQTASNYGKPETIFQISTTCVIEKVIETVISEIAFKVAKLESEIMN